MRKIIVCNIMSLDGYYEGPGANVMALPMDEAFDAYNLERIRSAGSVVLGRTSYQGFSSYWPGIADHPEQPESNRAYSQSNRALSRIYNGIEKVVVTDSYTPEPDNPWCSTTTVVSRSNSVEWLAERKASDGREILIYGSRTLWNHLLAADLIDEVHLMVGAVVLGGGTPTFSAPVDTLMLLESRRFDGSENVLLRYDSTGRGAVALDHSDEVLHMNPETELLLRHLNAQRQHVLAAIDGLTDEQLRRPVLPSGWSMLGMIKHLSLGDEHYWFRSIVGGESLDVLPEGQDSDWYVSDDETADDIIDLYRHEIAAANAIIAVTPLDDPPGQKDPTWREWGIDFPDLRDIILHVIAETACHAGHLDAARELIDGHQFLVM